MLITRRWITAPIIFAALVLGSLHIFKPELGTTAFIVETATAFIKTNQIDALAYGITENPYAPYLGCALLVLLAMGAMKAGINKYYQTPNTV